MSHRIPPSKEIKITNRNLASGYLYSLMRRSLRYALCTPSTVYLLDEIIPHQWLLGVFSSCRTAVDLAIACWMCYLLITKRTGFRRTKSVIRTLIHFTVATGCLTRYGLRLTIPPGENH